MSTATDSIRTRLDLLRERLDHAAYDFPNTHAVVVYRPDVRLAETRCRVREYQALLERIDRTIQVLKSWPDDPESVRLADELNFATEHARRYGVFSMGHVELVPPYSDLTFGNLGEEWIWRRVLLSDEIAERRVNSIRFEKWQCTLFGQTARPFENTAGGRFSILAEEAARRILPATSAKGTGLLSRWLIYLADRDEPIVPASRKQYLSWGTSKGPVESVMQRPEEERQKDLILPSMPTWVPVTPQNFPRNFPSSPQTGSGEARWWAVLLPNVFRLSRDAVEQFIGVMSDPKKGGRPRDPMTAAITNYVRELKENGKQMSWAEISAAVFKKYDRRLASETLRSYYRKIKAG